MFFFNHFASNCLLDLDCIHVIEMYLVKNNKVLFQIMTLFIVVFWHVTILNKYIYNNQVQLSKKRPNKCKETVKFRYQKQSQQMH